MNLPKSRTRNVVVQTLGSETLVYDLDTHQAFNLNETASVVYQNCDGKTTLSELKRRYKLTDDVIYFALDELKANNLLAGEVENHFGGLSRREVIKRVGLASMVALPIVAGLVAPRAAEAASGSGGTVQANQPCIYNNETQSNCANGLRCTSPTSTCSACVASGDGFFIIGIGGTVAQCNARPERNRCCNTVGDSTVNGSVCVCP